MSGEGLRRASSASSRDSALIFQIRNIRQLLSSPYEPIRACWARPKTSHAGGGGGGAASMFSAAISASSTGTRPAPVSLTARSEEHTSELQSLMRISYAVFCLKKKTHK